VKRGLPRPSNKAGTPIPYIAESGAKLGTAHLTRRLEVTQGWLCQVCGEPVGWPAYGVVCVDGSRWQPDWLLDHGLLHGACMRLSLDHCPVLGTWSGLLLLELNRADVTMTEHFQLVVPATVQERTAIDVSRFRQPGPATP